MIIVDPSSRVEELLSSAEKRLIRRFLEAVAAAQSAISLDELEALVASGQTEELIRVIQSFSLSVSATLNQEFIQAATQTILFLNQQGLTQAVLDQSVSRFSQRLTATRLRIVQGLEVEQRRILSQILQDGFTQGLNPRETARRVRASIGLTPRQTSAVTNYENLLRTGNLEVLNRELRDRRFDRTIRRTFKDGDTLTEAQISRIVDRYRQRYIDFRARTIARTESLRAIHQGVFEAYEQAVDQGVIEADKISRTWVTAGDERVRDSHSPMNGQITPGLETPFISGDGNLLLFPGDPAAPPSDTIQCRCSVATRVSV